MKFLDLQTFVTPGWARTVSPQHRFVNTRQQYIKQEPGYTTVQGLFEHGGAKQYCLSS